jgi:hypothetical protein
MRTSFVRSMAYYSTTMFLPGSRWFLESLQFVTDKFVDMTLQEPESHGIIGSDTDHLPPAPVRVGLINEAQLGHGLSELGKTGLDLIGDKADDTLVVPAATMDPIYQSSSESDFEGSVEVYMVGNREELPDKSIEEIQRETNEEFTCVARLAREAERGKRHNNQRDDSGTLEDEPRDGAPVRRHHPKFNSRCNADRDRLWNRSWSICEEIGQIEYQGEQVYRTLAQNALVSRMLIDQLTPTCQKTMKKSTYTWSASRSGRVLMGTRQAISLHWRNASEDETGMTEICVTSSTTEMHVTGLKTSARSVSALNWSSVKKGTMTTTVLITTNLIVIVLSKGGTMQEESRLFPRL